MANILSTDEIITAIDIGTTKIIVLVARKLSNESLEVIGIGKSPSHGLQKGVVVDVGKTVHALRSAIKEAEIMANITIETVAVGIAGNHIKSVNSHGVIPIKKNYIQQSDIDTVLAAAKAIPLDKTDKLLHVFPQWFVIDGAKSVANPLGMHGIRLEVHTHMILGSVASVCDIVQCCQQAGVSVNNVILEPVASAYAVLTPDEQSLGIALLDIGGGTTDLALFHRSAIRHTFVLPIAGSHLTQDIAIGLRTPLEKAELIKKEHGLASVLSLQKDNFFQIDQIQQENNHQLICLSDIIRIIQPRIGEMLLLIKKEIDTQNLQPFMTTGMVITGGGSLLKGIDTYAEHIFKAPIRLGKPHVIYDLPESLRHPMYATSYGLLLYVLLQNKKEIIRGTLTERVSHYMKKWITDIF